MKQGSRITAFASEVQQNWHIYSWIV